MMLRPLVGLFSMQLLILSFFLSLSLAARSVYAQLIPQTLMQKAQSEGEVRVIVRLAVSDTPGTWVNSDILQSLRRADIARAQNSVRAGLLNVRHQVRRQFEDFPFIALQVGADGLRTLELLRGVVEVVEDQLSAPFLAESVPLVQADQVWPGGSAGLALDGGGTVVAVLDTGVDKTHPFLGGKVVEEACFSTNDPNSFATSVCPGGVESSFVEGSGLPCDVLPDCDHGTHVAGIAAGNGQDGAVAPFSGVAKGAKIMAVQIFTMISNSLTCSSFSYSVSFLSPLAPGQWIDSSIPGGGFANFAGTSMATPHVAGAFAILKQATPTATVDQLLSALQGAGLPVTDARNSITKPRIRILNALGQAPALQFDSATYSVGDGEGSATITVTRTGSTTGVSAVQY